MYFKVFVQTFHMVRFLLYILTLKFSLFMTWNNGYPPSTCLYLKADFMNDQFPHSLGRGPPALSAVGIVHVAAKRGCPPPPQKAMAWCSAEAWRSSQRGACCDWHTGLSSGSTTAHTQEHLWANDLASLILVSLPEEEGPGQHTPRGAGWGLSDMPCGEGSA